MTWNISIIIIGLLMAAFAARREYQRANKARLFWRMITAMIAPISLACAILPLSYSTTVTTSTGTGKILLTDGFSTDSLGNNDSIFTLDPAIHKKYPKAKLLDDARQLFIDSASISPIHILGYGLDADELKPLNDKPVAFYPAPIPDGFTAASWTEKLKTGQTFVVQGSYKNTSAKAYSLVLKGANTTLDSVRIPAGPPSSFTLKTTPKNSGRMVYQLIALNGKDTLQQESLPIVIEKNQPLKVLVLSSSPDFESKFLKNWLGANGYSVASRTNITKGKTGQEFINMDQPDLAHITTGLLGKFDVVIGDLSVFKNLSTAENSALQQEVAQKGLGVIIRADSSDKKISWLQSNFPLNNIAGKQAALSALNIQGKGKTAKLNIDPVNIITQNNTQILVSDEHGRALSAISMNGAGKLVFTTINNSYSWMLAGDQTDYTALWSLLIDKAARKMQVADSWLVNGMPMVDRPVNLVLETGQPASLVGVNNTMVAPAQNPDIPFQQSFTYWPATYGWQQVIGHSGTPYWWYTWKGNEWATMAAAKKMEATTRYTRQSPANSSVTKQILQKTNAPVPKIYFYMLFLVAATFLWAESKFFS